MAKSHYEVLGVKRNATEDEQRIQEAGSSSPDKNLGRAKEATMAFQPLKRAHETLTSPQKRAKYDQQLGAILKAQDSKPDSNRAQPTTSKQNPTESSNEPRFYSYEFSSSADKEEDLVEEEEDDPVEVIMAIKDIKNNQVTIRARVTDKSNIIPWFRGTFFNMDLLDGSGEIRMTGFNTAVDSFYNMIQVDQVYDISWFNVKPANKQFTSIKHDYEIIFNTYTQVITVKDTSDIPQATYNFVRIDEIERVDVNKTIDVIGVCKSVGHSQNVTCKKTGKQVNIREVVLIDNSCKKIVLTLWGKLAEDFSDDTQPIIAVKGAQVSGFGGRSLSCLSSLTFQVNPDLPEAHALRKWYDSEGLNLTKQTLSSVRGSSSTFASSGTK